MNGALAITIALTMLAPGESPSTADEPTPPKAPQLWVELVETTGLAENVRAALEQEVGDIYRSGGVEILWLDQPPARLAPHVARVYVMDVLPASLASRLRAFHRNGAPPVAIGLGSEGSVSGPVLYVSRKGVLAKAMNGGVAEPPPEVVVRALGRVIAHELAHRFLQRRHTRRGILKADFSHSDLVGDGGWARFTKEEAARLVSIAYREGSQPELESS